MRSRLVTANRLALLVSAVLIAGALGSQYLGRLYPCEMCHWQRWPHYGAIVVALFAFFVPVPARRALVLLAAALIAVSGAIGVFHAGVEYGWWPGITGCTSTVRMGGSTEDMLKNILAAPMVRCDVAQWRLAGVSLAGWNALVSLIGAGVVARLAAKR